ncbi:MAG: ATP-binding protein [Thermofilum sp.]|nr:ATP-binding protein [Thermofilum sp.]
MRRLKLQLAPGLEVEFADREGALKLVEELAERGTRFPVVVFGPEGCGKTAWLKQSAELLRERGFDAVYVDPLRRDFIARTDVSEVARKLAEAAAEAIGVAQLKLATLAIDAAKELVGRWGRKRVAVLVDEVFQAIGLDKAETYVKSLLNLIEYPPASYESIVIIAATSEGATREKIGRHLWALPRPMWNMSREGFERLYEQLPDPKPDLEEAWRMTGGNPRVLSLLHQAGWSAERTVTDLAEAKGLAPSFVEKWRGWLEEAVEDPDALWRADTPEELVKELVERNLIVYNVYDRQPWLWIDQPPPEKDLEIGVGKRIAWQTPLHREAVKRALEKRA